MLTPIGGSTEMTAASVRADINRVQETDYFNKDDAPMKMARVPDNVLPELNPGLAASGLTQRQQRMLRLADVALKEALAAYPLAEPVLLFLAGPETLPGCTTAIAENFLDALMQQTGANLHRKHSRLFASGRSGGLQAIEMAFNYFAATGKDFALVGGVDTHLHDFRLLETLDQDDRILAEGVTDGFAPGEAAGFLLLSSARVPPPAGNTQQIRLYPPGLANEPGHRFSDQPYRGDGMANAFRLAIANAPAAPIKAIYASLNGENFGAKEYGVALTRNSSAIDENLELEHPADCFGDIGAAFAPVLLGLSAYGLAKQQLQGTVLTCCASEHALRGAACVSLA